MERRECCITQELLDYVADIRHRIHQEPELSMQEYETTELICRELEEFGLEVICWPDLTGAVGVLRGAGPGPAIAFRADIDALPIRENSGSKWTSRKEGVMHACAHDGHTALLLGLAKYYAERREELAGVIKFIFQPGEELPPGGALKMIEKGILDNPPVKAVFGLHHATENKTGDIGVLAGPFLAGSDSFTLTIHVKGGGGSAPHKGVDGIMVGAEIVTAIEVEMTRQIDPLKPGLVSFGTFHAGTAFNILAGQVVITGTVRFFDDDTGERIHRLIRDVSRSIAERYGGTAELDYQRGYPGVINDERMTELVRQAAENVLGAEHVKRAEPLMAGDDMAYFLREVPGSYYWWGITPEEGMIAPAHTEKFDFDENAFSTALKVNIEIVRMALERLAEE